VQFGASVGEIEYDGGIDVDAGGGFTMTGGYRTLSWLALEANVTYLGGGDAEVGNVDLGEADFFAITFGPKLFPMAAFDEQPIPEFFQPYALVGIGGGEFDIDVNGGGNWEKSTFIARFIFGFDIWITDHIGAFVEGGYHAAADDDIDGAGIFSLGGQYRF
jgi:opacity protein-like surface antigen